MSTDEQKADVVACATEGCPNPASQWFYGGGVGSIHCPACVENIRAIAQRPASPPSRIGGAMSKPDEVSQEDWNKARWLHDSLYATIFDHELKEDDVSQIARAIAAARAEGRAEARETALQERIKELEGALRPFAKLGEQVERDYPDYADHILLFFHLTHGDFRRSIATLKDSGNG